MEPLSVRCSSLPLAARCAASQVAPALKVEPDDAAARLGSAVHYALAQCVSDGAAGNHHVERAAAMFDVPLHEVAALAYQGWHHWDRGGARPALKLFFPDPKVEEPLALVSVGYGLELTGHADVLSDTVETVRVLDWKTGHGDGDHDEQLKGYCWLALANSGMATRAYGAVVRLRDGSIDGRWYDRGELADWWAGLAQRLLERDTYRPGPHCGRCPRALECPGRNLALQAASEIFLNDFAPPMAPAERLVQVGIMLRQLKQAAEDGLEAVRAEVVARGGRVQGEAAALVVTQQRRQKIDARAGLPVLRQHLTEAQLADCLSVNKSEVETAVRATAARGQKKYAAEALLAQLRDAGALVTTTVEPLEIKHGKPADAAIESDAGRGP